MLRTTLALKDEASSDTVSTEFNYLQPTVRRLDIAERASIPTSQYGGVIHVQEHEISEETNPEETSVINNHSVIHSGEADIEALMKKKIQE